MISFREFLSEASREKSQWKREHPGRYVHRKSGHVIERNLRRGWNVTNPQTGKVFDSLPTKREAMRTYGGEWK